jgi:hypothetical protein
LYGFYGLAILYNLYQSINKKYLAQLLLLLISLLSICLFSLTESTIIARPRLAVVVNVYIGLYLAYAMALTDPPGGTDTQQSP